MAELNAKIEVDVSASAQKALNEFARDMHDKYGLTIESVHFEWLHTMGGDSHLVNSEMTTGSRG